jgi:protein-tyrosine phosphatase
MAGEYPGSIQGTEARGKLFWLLEQQIDIFVDLTEAGESDLIPYTQLLLEEAVQFHKAVMYKRMPIRDFSAPSQKEIVEILDVIDAALSADQNVYLHCFGGKGRTGMVVGCYLARHGLPGKKALERIQELRSKIKDAGRSPETEGQKRMVLEWNKGL